MTVLFPKWANRLPAILAASLILGSGSVVGAVWYYFSPRNTDVGYAPDQPVRYSHRLHAGQMGMDCRYCHTSVEDGPHANVPPTSTCMNCHAKVRTERPEIQKIAAADGAGEPIRWQKVHLLPDYVQFHHAAHVRAGVGCTSCHGRVDQMDVVRQVEPLSMGWCLECHRNPAAHVRPLDEGVGVTDMDWQPTEASIRKAQARVDAGAIRPPEHCSACHR